VAMAGDTITMGAGTMVMIHEAMSMCFGFASDMKQMSATLETVSSSAADIYCVRTGMKKDEVLTMMAAETWLSAQDALDKGFATALSAEEAKISNAFNLLVFKNTPTALLEMIPPVEPPYVEDPLIGIFQKRLDLMKRA
jgi:ATP-dependent Clp protease protease subunit